MSPSFVSNKKSVYGTNGYFSAFGFYDGMIPTPNSNLFQHGYSLGYFLGLTKYTDVLPTQAMGAAIAFQQQSIKAFPGHDLIYGSATSQAGTSFAVLKLIADLDFY